jgi:predicted nucleotidyltransferase/HEPN domain-containing protein
MKSNLDHLPAVQQDELERITGILLRGFEQAVAGGTQPWRRGAKIYKIILFGSYARGDFVDEPENGYLSDFDILVVVSDEKLTDIAGYWWETEQRILHDPTIGRTVNLIVHDLDAVNHALARGQYFFRDVVRDGVSLYEVPGHSFATPKPVTPEEALAAASEHLETRFDDFDLGLEDASRHVARAAGSLARRKKAAFYLHQAAETAYICMLLVKTSYFPRSHNLKFLRSLAEDVENQLIGIWPRETRAERRPFEHLKRAYVDARYNQFDISADDLTSLFDAVTALGAMVRRLSEEHIAQLRRDADQTP